MSHPRTAEQVAAITSTAREVLLRAGAGSGKTTVLVDRYCDLVASGEFTVDEILAFTFTRKAAAQLRERIRLALLERAERAADDGIATRLNDAVARVGSAWVMTIHGFCQAVVGAHPVAAGIDPEFNLIEDLAREKLRHSAFERALDRFLADPDESASREEMVAAYGIANLRELILDIYDELRSHGIPDPTLPEPTETDPIEPLDRLATACSRLLADDRYRRHVRNHDKIVNLARIAAAGREWLDGDEPEAGPEALLAELEANWFNSRAEGKAEICDLLNEACRVLVEHVAGRDCYRQIGSLLDRYGSEFSAAKANRSALDFDDLQLIAVQLLRDNPAIGDGYRSRFRQIMIDEFQDTSPVQIALVEALRGPETDLFQVGDKFQAIYAFRHADLANFDRVGRRLQSAEDAEVLPLSGNFRSSAAILSVVNGLASELLPGFPELRVGSENQSREPRGGGSGVELILTAPNGWDEAEPAPVAPEGVSPRRAAEAEAVAHRLSQLVAAGVPRGDIVVLMRALSQAGAYAAALERHDLRPFVVDGRGFWQDPEIVDAIALLRAVANPLDEEGLFGALAGPACAASPDALWLLRRAAGRTPIWHAIAALAETVDAALPPPPNPQWLAEIEPDDGAAIVDLYAELQRLRNLRAELPLSELVETALTGSGLDLAATAARGSVGLAALRKLSRLAGEYEAADGRDLRGFLDYARMQAERGADGQAPIAAEGHDGVRIMTMHAAKGLEFPVVAVPELGRRFGGGPSAPALRLSRKPDGDWLVGFSFARLGRDNVKLFDCDAIEEVTRAEQAAEELRLFYVAMTRAQERLILSGRALPPPKDGISDTTPVMPRLLDLLGIEVSRDGPPPDVDPAVIFPAAQPRADLDARFAPAALEIRLNWPDSEHRLALSEAPVESEVARSEGEMTVGEGEPSTGQLETTLSETAPTAAVEPIPEPPPPLPALSFSSLIAREAGQEDPVTAGADDSDTAAPDRASDELGLDAAGVSFGLAVHGLLERAVMPSARGTRWRPITDAMILRALAEQGLGAEGLTRARRQIEGWLKSDLCEEISRPAVRLRVETPLLLRLDQGEGAILRGWIDLLAERPDRPPLVIDFKTNRLDGRSATEVAADYGLQAEIYALAVGRALGAREVEVAFAVLDAIEAPVRTSFGPDELEAAEAGLIERLQALRSGVGRAFETGGQLV